MKKQNLEKTTCGGVAQLGEHLLCKQGVRSSILLISTKGQGIELNHIGLKLIKSDWYFVVFVRKSEALAEETKYGLNLRFNKGA